jgi:hypothetical protein
MGSVKVDKLYLNQETVSIAIKGTGARVVLGCCAEASSLTNNAECFRLGRHGSIEAWFKVRESVYMGAQSVGRHTCAGDFTGTSIEGATKTKSVSR